MVVVGHGCVALDGGAADFIYSEVFTFASRLVSRLATFHISLGDLPKG